MFTFIRIRITASVLKMLIGIFTNNWTYRRQSEFRTIQLPATKLLTKLFNITLDAFEIHFMILFKFLFVMRAYFLRIFTISTVHKSTF